MTDLTRLEAMNGIFVEMNAPGIGPVKRKALLKHFGSVDRIRAASVVELAAVPGINQALAEGIKAQLE